MALKVGIQLYSVRENMAKDPLGTIEAVGKAGYRYIELANHAADRDPGCGFGVPAGELRATLDRLGMGVAASHISPASGSLVNITDEDLARVIDYHSEIGSGAIVEAISFVPDRDQVLRNCERYNYLGEKIRAGGLDFLYHNHYMEFQHFGDEMVLETILKNTDPKYLNLELDSYWALRGGVNPVDFINQYGNRIKLLHQKDFPKDIEKPLNLLAVVGEEGCIDMDVFIHSYTSQEFTEIGDGLIDIQAIINKANEIGVAKFIILEQDFTQKTEFESIARSMENFRKFEGLTWA